MLTPFPELKIRDVHEADRPRERLIRQGAQSLSNQELLAILLRTGTKEDSYISPCQSNIDEFSRNCMHYETRQLKK